MKTILRRTVLFLGLIMLSAMAFRVQAQAVTVNATDLTTGLSPSPLLGGSTARVVFGFELNKAAGGLNTITQITVSADQDPTTSLVSASLHRSTNASYDGGEPLISNGVLNGAPANTITFDPIAPAINLYDFGALPTAGDTYLFVLVEVRSDVSTSPTTPAITLTVNGADVITSTGTVTGSTSGNAYAFTALNTTLASAAGGVANTVVAGDNNRAILGFSATSNGTQSLDDIVFTLDIDPSTGPLSGFQLVNNGASAIYSGGGSVLGTVPALGASTVTFTNMAQPVSTTPTYFFLIADVSPGATAGDDFTTTLTSATTDVSTTSGAGFTHGPVTIGALNATLSQLTAGIAPSPLPAGATAQAILGFSLASNGSQTASSIEVQLTTDPAGKLGNFVLVRSADNSYATAGDNSTAVPNANISVSGSGPWIVTITPGTPLDISSAAATNFFLVADVNSGVTSGSGNIQPSLAIADVTLNPSGLTGSTINGTNYAFSAAQTSTITVDYVGQGAFDFSEYTQQTSSGLTTANSQKAFGIDVTDADADSQPTTITSLTLQIADAANLNAIALFDNATNTIIPGTEKNVAANIDGSGRIVFNGLNFAVPDGSVGTPSVRTIDVYITFMPTVVDNDRITISVYAATALNTGSGLAALGSVTTGATNNEINVVSTKLIFNSVPTDGVPGVGFSAIVWATDANGIIDTDASDQVSITESGPGTGNLSGGGAISPVNGVYTFPSLSIDLAGDYNLTAADAASGQTLDDAAALIDITSLGVQITDGIGSAPLFLNLCYGGAFQALGSIKLAESDPADFQSGGIFMLKLPAGFIFNTAVNPTVSETGNEITINSLGTYYVGTDVVRISYAVSGTSNPTLDAITIAGLQVRYPSTTPTPGGEILTVDASAIQVGNAEADAQTHGTLTASSADPTGFNFEVAAFPGQGAIQPEETRFSYTIAGILLRPSASNPATTNNVFSGNGVSFSSQQNSYVFSPASVGVGSNYEITFTGLTASGCLVTVTKTFQVYANSINGLLSEYCINDNTTQSLSVDPSRYNISSYYAAWNALAFYSVGNRVSFASRAYQATAASFGVSPPNAAYWKEVGYSFSGDYSISISSYRQITAVTNLGGGNIIVNSPSHGFANGTTLYLEYYVYDFFFNLLFYIPYNPYVISNVTANTFTINYNEPNVGFYNAGFGGIYIPNPPITNVSVSGNVITVIAPNHGLSNGARVRVNLGGLSGNGISSYIDDWYTVSSVTANSFRITCPVVVTGTWNGTGYVDIFNYRISTFVPADINELNSNFGTVTTAYVGFIVNQLGCDVAAGNTCRSFIYTNEPVKLNQLAALDFTGMNATGAYCATSTPITLTGNQSDGSFSGPGITDGGANSNTATFNPGAGSITQGVPFDITYAYTDAKNCAATFSRSVTVNPTPPPPTPAQPQFGYCEGDTQPLIMKVGGTGTDFAWYNNASKTTLLGVGPLYDASAVGTGNPITQPFFAAQSVAGCESNTVQVDLVVNELPDADFTNSGQCAGDTVRFNGPSGSIATWAWDFGDGSVSTEENPDHIFADSRTYSVRLDVTSTVLPGDAVCYNFKTTNVFIGFNPSMDFTYERICDGDDTEFEHTSTPPLDSLAWDFGNGIVTAYGKANAPIVGVPNTTGTYGNPTHHYTTYGPYAAEVAGKTTIGCVDTVRRTVPILIKLTPTPGDPYLMRTARPNGEDGYWLVETTVDSTSTWEFNVPQGGVLSATDSTWITNAAGTYKSNDLSYVNSPCFDLTAYDKPLITLKYLNDTQPGRDGVVLEYSTNSGQSWTRLGNAGTGLDWYNNYPVNALGNVFGWSEAGVTDFRDGYHSLSSIPQALRGNVRFRIKFASDQDTEGEGFAFNRVNIVEKNRQVLVENFTNSSQAETINHNTVFRNLDTHISASEYVPLEYHIVPAGFGDDPINEQNKADHNARAAFYGITQNYTSVQDGLLTGNFNALATTALRPEFEDDFNLRSLRSSPVTLDIVTNVNAAQELEVKVTVTALEDLDTSEPMMVQIALVERTLDDPALAGANGETVFKYVMRKMLPNAAGTRLVVPLAQGETFEVTESIAITNSLFSDVTELAVVAFVQSQSVNALGRNEVWQAAIKEDPAQPPVVTGLEPTFGEQIILFPNPASTEVSIHLPYKATSTCPVTLTDNFGREVYKTSFRTGERTKAVPTATLADGVYMVHIQGSKGESALKKLMVLHK